MCLWDYYPDFILNFLSCKIKANRPNLSSQIESLKVFLMCVSLRR